MMPNEVIYGTASIESGVQARGGQAYGARRVRRDLRDWGHRCGVHRVHRLMRRAELVARPRRRRLPSDQGLRPEHSIIPSADTRRWDT